MKPRYAMTLSMLAGLAVKTFMHKPNRPCLFRR